MNKNNPWWDDFFDENFARLSLERSDKKQLDAELDFLIHQLQLKKNQIVFDQCCGIGTLSHAMAKTGVQTIGIDQSESYINIAKQSAQKTHASCTFFHGDALTFVCPEKVDAAFNWYSSFGYSAKDELNLCMLQRNYDSLKCGGRFVLDYVNPAFIFQHFMEQTLIQKQLPEGELNVYKHSSVDLKRGMLLSTWRYEFPDGRQVTKSGESRLYFANDLSQMLESCGFQIIDFHGDVSGSPLTKDTQRCIITAQKYE